MRFCINQVLIQGSIKHRKGEQNKIKKTNFKLGRNTVVISQKTLYLFLCKDIQFFFHHFQYCKQNIVKLLNCLFDRRIKSVNFKIVNIHYKLTIQEKPHIVLTTIVPILAEKFGFDIVDFDQEAASSAPHSIEVIRQNEIPMYMSYCVRIFDQIVKVIEEGEEKEEEKFITVKFLKNKKQPKETNLTVIASTLSQKVREFISFVEEEKWKE